jgi:hypothetical protein
VRWYLSSELVLMPVLFAGLSACMSMAAVPNENAAIVIFKKMCPYPVRSGFGPYDQWDAQLVGNHWRVHARSQIIYSGKMPNWVDAYLDVPKDGTPPTGHCLEQATE